MLTKQHRQESLSRSFVQAIAVTAGVDPGFDQGFDYGVDGQFRTIVDRNGRYTRTGTALDYQLKASINWFKRGNTIVYDLDVKKYNDLVERSEGVGLILILLGLPRAENHWIHHAEDALLLRHRCFWYHVRGKSVNNREKKRIYIPAQHLFNVDAIKSLMEAARAREFG
ncbi:MULTISPECIES: DUF4365 domain-containing protein [unclassified Methylobacterium]|uniref:DUF4365 domain-containing protein n=1 Tax=unclassified Methylobacterium TaxID=2615210 RepID=UPI0022699967